MIHFFIDAPLVVCIDRVDLVHICIHISSFTRTKVDAPLPETALYDLHIGNRKSY